MERKDNCEHPGVLLAAELKRRGLLQTDLTFILGRNAKAVNQIINGKQGVSAAMSKALGKALGVSDDYFAGLQRDFDLFGADEPDNGIESRARMMKTYPIREMIKRGWLRASDHEDLSTQLSNFFEVNDLSSIPYMTHAAKRTIYEEKEIPGPQIAWLFRVRQIAKSMAVPQYSQTGLSDACQRMKSLLLDPEEARHVPRLLSECGVRLVIVEPVPSSKIDGVCFWLDKRSPVIGLSFRFDRFDNFWFVLRHEIEHVLQGHGLGKVEGMIDAELQGERAGTGDNVPGEERVANAAASDFCVPRQKMESFLLRKNPFFYEKDVLAFSKLNGVHPSLPVGQIQHHTGRHDYLRKYQIKIRHHVTPGAIVDGWDQSLDLA